MNPPERHQRPGLPGAERELVEVQPVVHRRGVAQAGRAVGVRYRDERGA
jgi:hypothetical protein